MVRLMACGGRGFAPDPRIFKAWTDAPNDGFCNAEGRIAGVWRYALVCGATATHDTIMKADRRGRLRFSHEQRTALLKAYQASGPSGPRFATLHGVKYPSLANWV
jgi:hypothetical protein